MKSVTEIKSQLSKKTLQQYFEFWNGNEENLMRFLPDSYINRPILNYLSSRNIEISGKKILEFGCRDGSSFISFLSKGASQIIVIDINKKALNLSKSIFYDLGYQNIDYRLSFVKSHLPIIKEEFDIVSCNAVLEHLHPKERAWYIFELQNAVKPGGYFIVSDTPNRLWPREGHTTGIWFLNYFPFKIKCWAASKTKRFSGKVKYNDFEYWISQGIVEVTYREVYELFQRNEWDNYHDLSFKQEYNEQLFNKKNRKIVVKIVRFLLYLYVLFIDRFYLKRFKYPSLAIAPSLLFSFRKKQ